MSDLDDFFAKRLDEEAAFPNRGKQWKQVSKRLDAFDMGTVQGNPNRLRLWQAAALIAVAAAGFLLWKTTATQRENKVLRQDVAALQTERSNLADQLALAEKRNVEPSLIEQGNSVQGNNKTEETLHFSNPKTAKSPFRPQPSLMEEKISQSISVAETQSEKLPEIDSQKFEGLDSSSSIAIVSPGLPDNLDFQKNEQADTAYVKPSDIASAPNSIDTLKKASPKADSLMAVVEKPIDEIAKVPSPAQEIKPSGDPKSRFRVGAQATVGFVQPNQKGVSAIRGQGFTFEVKVFPSIWITGSVDWLNHDVSTVDFVPRFHPHHDSLPKPPGGGGGGGGPMPPKLILVESSPRQQQFGLGIRYELPVEFWVRPSVRVAHEWVRTSPTLVTYKFEEPNFGGPGPFPPPRHEYTAEKFDSQWLSNQWRFGIGLEKDIPNWTFGLWADYSKDFSAATPSFDAMYLRAGAQYRF